MKRIHRLVAPLIVAAGLSACAGTAPVTDSPALAEVPAVDQETLLLVRLEDGRMIMQRIESNADVCWKDNTEAHTSCFSRGEPIFDAHSNSVVGYEIVQSSIELYAAE